MKKFLLLILLAAAAVSCGIYSFTGTNIQSDVKTITIPFVEYKALRVNPSLSNDLTEALQEKFRKLTSLEQVDQDGDLELVCEVTGYDVQAKGIKAGDLVKDLAAACGGRGGGRPDRAQAGTKEVEKIAGAIANANNWIRAKLG